MKMSLRIRLGLVVIAFIVLTFGGTFAQDAKVYRLVPELKPQQKFNVQQEIKWDGTSVINVDSEKIQQSFMYQTRHQYTEEITEVGEKIKSTRSYKLSQKKFNSVAEGIKTEPTSLEGKTLKLETVNQLVTVEESAQKTPDEKSLILDKDKIYLTSLTECAVFLPETVVKIGDEWDIKNNVGKVVFKSSGEDSSSAEGKGKFKEIVEYKNILCAKIDFNVTLKNSEAGKAPSFQSELDGVIYFSLDNVMIIGAEINGSFSGQYEAKESTEVEISGNYSSSFLCLPEKAPSK